MVPLDQPSAAHLHTNFLFAFAVDREAVLEAHPAIWRDDQNWFGRLDPWLEAHHSPDDYPVVRMLGPWRRATYTRFDLESRAYQDMVFFHPFVRRVFFDTVATSLDSSEHASLLRCYTIALDEDKRVTLSAEDRRGRHAVVNLNELRLFLFANGIGILSISVEADDLPVSEALWINEMMRKVYATSGRQLRESRLPSSIRLAMEWDGQQQTVAEEDFRGGEMVSFQPPLSNIITSLLYFVDYANIEFEPVLDERMIVYSYLALDAKSLPPGYQDSEAYEVLLSRFMYVDRDSKDFRYDADFVREQMRRSVYRRWAHQGTYYAFTSYSNVTLCIGTFDCDEHSLREGFLIHRMFETRYYLMAVIALFYRATLLDFAERTALVTKRLFLDQTYSRVLPENVRMANALQAAFLHFSNYWYFEELANKDEEIEHFAMQCDAYRLGPMKAESEREIDKLSSSLDNYYQRNNTEAVNRLALLSTILGAGAVLTGYFGMNFGKEFAALFFEPPAHQAEAHYFMVGLVTLFAFTSLLLGLYLIIANWADYKNTLVPKQLRRKKPTNAQSIKRVLSASSEE